MKIIRQSATAVPGNVIILAILLVGLAFIGAPLAPSAISGAGAAACDWTGGKWASARGSCVRWDCYAKGACGVWANPGVRCKYLKPGDAIDEVYFQLGEPTRVHGGAYTWFGKGNFGPDPDIAADMSHGRLMSLRC